MPFSWRAVQVVEGVPDFMAHHVGRGRGPGAHHDLAVAVGSRAGVPGRLARRQLDAVQHPHVVQVGYSALAHVDPVKARGELLLQLPGELRQPVDRGDGLRRRSGRGRRG